MKKEYKQANKTREGYIDESEEEEDDGTKLSSSHKSMQKLLKKLDSTLQGDDDDDDANPYASGVRDFSPVLYLQQFNCRCLQEESSEEEEPPQVPTGPAIQPHEPKAGSRAGSQAPAGTKTPTSSQAPVKQESPSRATSPAPPGHGGHSVVAKRATSPMVPKAKPNGSSRAGSPLGGAGSRATSPVAGGGGTPGGSRAESPPAQGADVSKKRKAADEPTSPTNPASGGAPSKPKKRKGTTAGAAGEITQQMLVDWLTNTPNATTKDCIAYFSPYLPKEDKQKKQAFADLVKEVATLKDGVLVLRNAYRGTGGAASPASG